VLHVMLCRVQMYVCVKEQNSINNFCDKLLERKFLGIEGDKKYNLDGAQGGTVVHCCVQVLAMVLVVLAHT